MPKFHFSKKTALLLILAVFLLTIDRFLKFIAINNIVNSYDIIGKFLSFSFTPNPYIAFSIPLSGFFLSILISLIILYLIFIFLKNTENSYVSFSLFLIILGACSNLFDRIKYSFVIDYIDLKYFTIFNIADAMISMGVLLLLFIVINKNNSFIV